MSQADELLRLLGPTARIVSAVSLTRHPGDGPVLVTVDGASTRSTRVVVRRSRKPHGVNNEVALLPLLHDLGLRVPAILGGPFVDNGGAAPVAWYIREYLPGRTLGDSAQRGELSVPDAIDLLCRAIATLHAMTHDLRAHQAPVPTRSLHDEWAMASRLADDSADDLLKAASRHVGAAIMSIGDGDPMFTNGDPQPHNFVVSPTGELAFLDFDKPAFADPHIEMTRYVLYRYEPFLEHGVIQHYLEKEGVRPEDFAVRVACRSILYLVSKAELDVGSDLRNHWRSLLKRALQDLA